MLSKKLLILKHIAYVFAGIVIIGILGIAYFYSTFDLAGEPVLEELKRVTSPDSMVDAILVESQGGATVSNSHHVYIVPKGRSFESGYKQFTADHIIDLDIYWKESNFLVIQYKQARIFKFTNFWHSAQMGDWSYVVELRLSPLTDSFSLSDFDRWLNIKDTKHNSDTSKVNY